MSWRIAGGPEREPVRFAVFGLEGIWVPSLLIDIVEERKRNAGGVCSSGSGSNAGPKETSVVCV
jgi:hypothetical protein